jgi:hypothetical protein
MFALCLRVNDSLLRTLAAEKVSCVVPTVILVASEFLIYVLFPQNGEKIPVEELYPSSAPSSGTAATAAGSATATEDLLEFGSPSKPKAATTVSSSMQGKTLLSPMCLNR